MKIQSIAALLLLSVVAFCTHAEESPNHLEPESGPFFGVPHLYDSREIGLLQSRLPFGDIRVFIAPSFVPHWAISLDCSNGRLTIAHIRVKAKNRNQKHQYTVRLDEVDLESRVTTRIATLINRHLAEVRYPPTFRAVLDGETYHFASFDKQAGIRYGTTWSPEGEPLASLIALVYALEQLAFVSESEQSDQLKRVEAVLLAAENAATTTR